MDAVADEVVDFGKGVGRHNIHTGDCSERFPRITGRRFCGGGSGELEGGIGVIVFGDGCEEED